jgi:hypothetical protein
VTKSKLFALVDFEGACKQYPDDEVVVIYNTAIPDFPDGIVGLLLTPREVLAKADKAGKPVMPWRHGDVMRVKAQA